MIRLPQGCMVWLGTLAWLLTAVAPAWAKIAPPERGRTYKLTKKHGPWMIMVTTMKGTTTEEHKAAEEAANDLVYELRLKGIPAYVHKTDAVIDRVDAIDREGRPSRKIQARQRPEFAVLAGNYDENDKESRTGKVAHKTLEFVKRFRPDVLKEHAKYLDMAAEQIGDQFNNAGFKGNKNYGPLYKAFIAPNPMLTPEEVAARRKDPLLQELNLGQENSIAQNTSQYTLVVATFEGKQTIKPARYNELDTVIKGGSLDESGALAINLAKAMRAQNIKAYVFHDKFRSVVTVGSFNSKEDPAIVETARKFGAKEKTNQQTKRPELYCEAVKIPGSGNTPEKVWVLDPSPKLIPVPKLR